MLTRITWALVAIGFGFLLAGFLISDQNVLLIIAIVVEIAAIILVLMSWARRAKEAGDAFDEDLTYADVGDDTAGDDDDEDEDEDELLGTFDDEDLAVTRVSRRKPAARKPAARKPAARKPAKAKPASRSKAKPAASKPAARKPAARKPAAAKAKPAARKPAAKAKAKPKPKAKPQRRKPSGR